MADVDEEMKDDHVHGDVTQALTDQLQHTTLARSVSSSSVTRDTAWRCVHIELVGHVGDEQQQHQGPAASFPRIQSGIWRINMATAQDLGAQVLLTQHNADPARCYYRRASTDLEGSVPQPLQQQPLAHPHLLNLYGARDALYVCEDGRPFAEYVKLSGGHQCVLRVFYGVLVGMQFIHDLGFTHGSVNTEHIVVGANNKGKLLTHFANFGSQQVGEPESEEETKESELKDRRGRTPETSDFQMLFKLDEVEFVKCMKGTIETIEQKLAERAGDDEEERTKLASFLALLTDTRVLLDRVLHGDISAGGAVRRPPLRMTRAALELKKLAERESIIYGELVSVAVQ